MRVLLVCHGYPPFGVAGVERVSEQTARSLTARGHEVTVLSRRPTAAPPTLALEHDVRDSVPVIWIAGGGATFGEYPGREPELEQAFERVLAETAPDVVLLSHLLHHSPGYVAIAHRWRIPVVTELHDFYFCCPRAHLERASGERCAGPEGGAACAVHCFPSDPPEEAQARWSLRSHTFRRALHDADVVLSPSELVASHFAERRGDALPIQVLGNGVPASFRRASEQRGRTRSETAPLHVASIGVATHHKGFHVAVEALKRAELRAARYTIFGMPTTPYDEQLRDAAKDVEGLELRLFGRFEPEQLPALLGDVDVVVVPSLVEETYSIAAREALACGVPVVASRLGALPAAVRDGGNGWLFNPGDASELAVLLQRFDEERDLLDALAGGIRDSDTITVEERAESLEAVLRDTIRAGARPATSEERELRLLREALTATLR